MDRILRRAEVELRLPSPLVEVRDERLAEAEIRLLVKRDDLIHPEMPGNKWRKLKYNLVAATDEGHDTLLTFGDSFGHLCAAARLGMADYALRR